MSQKNSDDEANSFFNSFWKYVQNKVVPAVIVASVPLAFGYAVRFEKVVDKVHQAEEERVTIKNTVKNVDDRNKLIAWMMCEDAIKREKKEAIKRCKTVLGEDI